GKGRGHKNQVNSSHRTVELGKTQVVTHRQSHPAEGGIKTADVSSGLDCTSLVEALCSAVKTEQVNLVVVSHPSSGRIEHEHAVAHLALRCAGQRYRTIHEPYPMARRGCRKPALHRAVSIRFPMFDLGA